MDQVDKVREAQIPDGFLTISEVDVPPGALTPEVRADLMYALPAGNPAKADEELPGNGWMQVNLQPGGDRRPLEELNIADPETKRLLEKAFNFPPHQRREIDLCKKLIKLLANRFTDPNSNWVPAKMRILYKLAEQRIMYIVHQRVMTVLSEEGFGESVSAQFIALQGALIFKDLFSDLAPIDFQLNLKRIQMDEEGNFMVGIGSTFHDWLKADPEAIAKYKVITIPDDCLSTAMTQLTMIRCLLEAGFRPDVIVVPITTAVTGGIEHLAAEVEKLKKQYGDFKLLIVPGARCDRVNDHMYLIADDGHQDVGDMGMWGRAFEKHELEEGFAEPIGNDLRIDQIEYVIHVLGGGLGYKDADQIPWEALANRLKISTEA